MTTTDTPRIGIIGFGEVGSSFARGLREQGAFDILAYDEPPGPRQKELAERRSVELAVPLLASPSGFMDRDIVFSSVPQDAALAAAGFCAPRIGPRPLYVDVNSLSPAVKRQVAEVVGGAGRDFVDAAIVGMPIRDLHRAQILAAGARAEAFAGLMTPHGMRIQVVGDAPGAAAGIKIVRSLLTKGLEVLLVEALVGARRYGLTEDIVASFCQLCEERPMRELLEFLVRSHPVHARRRSLEVAQTVETLEEAGVEPLMARAVLRRLQETAQGDYATLVGGVQPATLDDALAVFDRKWGDSRQDAASAPAVAG
ncbi:NAD(P)-dependent oxidoreductase [Pseudothauera rhizosphaerae]|uniref:NAD(P)-dependent oxidoreductase n=1 Tax=Pseudothauera rhizosphaerae TaxID=2565932 RepID=A0A4V3WC00_9RHOO|nr:NAD(P)-dependent oxidoreductase [Pseudothauera rhizosphaerae]THF65252.1 NAD(P)-dependent oxidoreductase [Pseudothauera rhizosphaerae]